MSYYLLKIIDQRFYNLTLILKPMLFYNPTNNAFVKLFYKLTDKFKSEHFLSTFLSGTYADITYGKTDDT